YINDASGVLQVGPDGMLRRLFASGLSARNGVSSLAVDTAGGLYAGVTIPDVYSSGQIVRLAADGTRPVVAGAAQSGLGGISDGCTPDAPGVSNALRATFHAPSDMAVDRAGNIYFAADQRIRAVKP